MESRQSMQKEQHGHTPFLFVYGTLMLGMNNPFAVTLQKSAVFVGSAIVHGQLFDYNNEYPCAVASIHKVDLIHGELYKLNQSTPILRELDAYEDCYFDEPGKSLFIRCVVPVLKHQGSLDIRAWMYFWNRPIDSLRKISHGNYRKHCM